MGGFTELPHKVMVGVKKAIVHLKSLGQRKQKLREAFRKHQLLLLLEHLFPLSETVDGTLGRCDN